MDNLPNEVLTIIFKHLHLQQKLECMFVCRKFAHTLSAGCLFETINVGRLGYSQSNREKRQDAVIEKAKSDPRYGKNCKRLLINTKNDDVFNIATLATTFPNLSFFRISQDLLEIPPAQYTQDDPFEGCKNNLKTLDVSNGNMVSPKNILKIS
jgi:hypothetical protein